MPEFNEGETKTAQVELTNPSAVSMFDYLGKLYLGANQAAIHETQFSLMPQETKVIPFPIVMPAAGVYPVFLDFYVGDDLIKHFQAAEQVTVAGVNLGLQGIDYPVYPCYRGRTTVEAIFSIPVVMCPPGSTLSISLVIPKDAAELPRYDIRYPDRAYSSDWNLLSAYITNDMLTEPSGLYLITDETELTINRYSATYGTTYRDWLPGGTYPLYLKVSLDGNQVTFEPIGTLVISATPMSSFSFSNLQTSVSFNGSRYEIDLSFTVTNSGGQTESHLIRAFHRRSTKIWSYLVRSSTFKTLSPGQSVNVNFPDCATANSGDKYYIILIDDQGAASAQVSETA